MCTLKRLISVIVFPVLCFISVSANATLISGSTARAQFENYQTTLGDTLETFDGFTQQTNLTTQIPGLTFKTTLDRFSGGNAVDLEVNVICSGGNPYGYSSCPSGNNNLIGGVRSGGITDGRSVYEIVFDTGMLRVGLERIWNTASLTRFYSGTTLLGQHQNTAGTEFVGFISDAANLITRVEMDGAMLNGYYQVGYANDLFYGNTPEQVIGQVPEPNILALLFIGLASLGITRKKKQA